MLVFSNTINLGRACAGFKEILLKGEALFLVFGFGFWFLVSFFHKQS